jgi:hypothetical protein
MAQYESAGFTGRGKKDHLKGLAGVQPAEENLLKLFLEHKLYMIY